MKEAVRPSESERKREREREFYHWPPLDVITVMRPSVTLANIYTMSVLMKLLDGKRAVEGS